jgi:hypothetical protein
MNPLIPFATLLAILVWADGRLVFDIPGFADPTVHRGLK